MDDKLGRRHRGQQFEVRLLPHQFPAQARPAQNLHLAEDHLGILSALTPEVAEPSARHLDHDGFWLRVTQAQYGQVTYGRTRKDSGGLRGTPQQPAQSEGLRTR